MAPLYDARFFANRAEDDIRKAHEAHESLILTTEHKDFAKSVSYPDAVLNETTKLLEELATKTQRAWVIERDGMDDPEIPDVEWQLINCLNSPLVLPSGQTINLMKFKPLCYYPMSIAAMGLRSHMTWMAKYMYSEDVRDWADTIKSAWGIIDAQTRKLEKSNKALEACLTLWQRARKPPLGSDAQFVRLARPPKGKRGFNRRADSWIRDRIAGLADDEADLAWKGRVATIAIRSGLKHTTTTSPCSKTIARRAWYKVGKEMEDARKDAREAAMYAKVERIRIKLVKNNFNPVLANVSASDMDLVREYMGVDIDIDDDERELILEDVAEATEKVAKLEAAYFDLCPKSKKTVVVEITPPPSKEEEQDEQEMIAELLALGF